MPYSLNEAVALNHDAIELMTPKTLAEVYNVMAPTANLVVVKRFATREDGIKRTLKVQAVAKFAIAAAAATAAAKAPKVAAAKAPKVAAAKAPKVATKATTGRVDSLSAKLREQILLGKKNEEIAEFLKLPKEKAHYPSWVRGDMRRKGNLPAGL